MKKIIRVNIVAELEIDTDWYYAQDSEIAQDKEKSEKLILDAERENYPEWLFDNFVSEKLEFI